MIKNWDFAKLKLDYSSMYPRSNHPSDIDMIYVGKHNFLVLAEIKNEQKELGWIQRKILQSIVDSWQADGIAVFAQHNKYVQNEDTEVDVPALFIKEMYPKKEGAWRTPRTPTKIEDILTLCGLYRNKNKEETV